MSDHPSEVSLSYEIFSRMAHPMELASRSVVCAAALGLASWSLALVGAVPWDDAGGGEGVAIAGCRCRGTYGSEQGKHDHEAHLRGRRIPLFRFAQRMVWSTRRSTLFRWQASST